MTKLSLPPLLATQAEFSDFLQSFEETSDNCTVVRRAY